MFLRPTRSSKVSVTSTVTSSVSLSSLNLSLGTPIPLSPARRKRSALKRSLIPDFVFGSAGSSSFPAPLMMMLGLSPGTSFTSKEPDANSIQKSSNAKYTPSPPKTCLLFGKSTRRLVSSSTSWHALYSTVKSSVAPCSSYRNEASAS